MLYQLSVNIVRTMKIKKLLTHLWYNDRIFKIVMTIMVLNFLILANYSLIYSHENSHKEIFRYFGCDSEIEVNFMSGSTTPINCNLDNANRIALNIAQSNVEATYVDMTFYRFMIIISILIFIKLSKLHKSISKDKWLKEKK